jgi:type II secretory pathway pseudopilin PulG
MKFARTTAGSASAPEAQSDARLAGAESGFTLAEVLAAMLFMAIVIPVAVQGLRIASLAGEVAERKSQAARIAESVLVDNLITTNSRPTRLDGVAYEGTREFRWTLRSEEWSQGLTNKPSAGTSALNQMAGSQPAVDQFSANQVNMNLVTAEVTYPVQSKEYTFRISTLVNPNE